MNNPAPAGSDNTALSKKILKGLYHAIVDDKVHIWSGYHYFDTYTPERRISKKKYNDTVRRMKKQGWIQESGKLGKIFLTLTRKGKVKALMSLMEENAKKMPTRWDGKWRIAIFDIPEREGDQERYKIRNCLKQCGFYCLQKSVYIHPREIPFHVIEYLKESGLAKFIRFLRVDRIDDGSELEKRFGLRKNISRIGMKQKMQGS